ncbi:MAG TPA: glycerol-3-phosphate dehydrogenase/oxidase [Mycobacteriales bacterium]|nr:glycerol-3-phosphate dehydrogenase/oxidase [Mycobacteriales bacterium]
MPGDDPSVLNLAQRRRSLSAATSGVHDVVVIGAGATGAGAALDAVGRGLSVVLVDAGDLAAGTSSRSGKTLHGGLRYLEQLNFRLVNAALHERNLLVTTLSPYLARPEPYTYPLTHHWERPYIGAGIALYDVMTLTRKGVPHHRHFTRKGVLAEAPALDPAKVVGGIRYYDVQIDDARHAMLLARTAAGLGAQVISRARVIDIPSNAGRVGGVVVEDLRTGTRHEIRARSVINAAGIWSAEIQKLAGRPTFRVQPAKGVHVVLPLSALDSRTTLFARAEDSVIIIRRWGDYWLLGTTDTPYDGDYSAPRVERAEIDYLLRNINRYLRTKIRREDIVGAFAGLRPLLAPMDDDPSATSALSRDHSVIPGPAGLVTIVGGKYTTYRPMAADAIDAAGRFLDGDLVGTGSETQPVLGSAGWTEILQRAPAIAELYGLDVREVQRLVHRYGALTEEVLAPAAADPRLARPLPGAPAYLAAEYRYAVTHEGALTLDDVLWHRTHVSFETSDGGAEAAPHVATLIATELGWDEAEQAAEVKRYREWIRLERAAL